MAFWSAGSWMVAARVGFVAEQHRRAEHAEARIDADVEVDRADIALDAAELDALDLARDRAELAAG